MEDGSQIQQDSVLTYVVHATVGRHALHNAGEHVYFVFRFEQRAAQIWVVAHQNAGVKCTVEEVISSVFEQRLFETFEAENLVRICEFLCLSLCMSATKGITARCKKGSTYLVGVDCEVTF